MFVLNIGCVLQIKIFSLSVYFSIVGRLLACVSKDIFATGWDISIYRFIYQNSYIDIADNHQAFPLDPIPLAPLSSHLARVLPAS